MTEENLKDKKDPHDTGHPLMDWWGRVLHRLPYDMKKGIWSRTNFRATLWIVFFNPLTWPLYLIGIIMFLVILFGNVK